MSSVEHPDWRPGDRPIEAPAEDPMEPPDDLVEAHTDNVIDHLEHDAEWLESVVRDDRSARLRAAAAEIRRLRYQLARDQDGLSSLLALLAARSVAMIPYVATNSRAADRLRETLDKLVRPALARFGKDVLSEGGDS